MFLLFSIYACFLYWREFRHPPPEQNASVLVFLINGYVALLLVWFVREMKDFRQRLVASIGISHFVYRAVLGAAPGLLAPAAPALRIAFLVAWGVAAGLCLSLLRQGPPPAPPSASPSSATPGER